jgi:hypothetical protein
VEALLSEYRGVLVVVSHDRQFVECTAERLFVLRGDGLVRLFDGSYSEVREQLIFAFSSLSARRFQHIAANKLPNPAAPGISTLETHSLVATKSDVAPSCFPLHVLHNT